MKKLTIIAVSLLTLSACSKSGSSSSSSSTVVSAHTWSYDMNIPGYSYHRSGNNTGIYNMNGTNIIGVGANEECQLSFSIVDSDIIMDGNFGFKQGDTTNKTGVYILTSLTQITDVLHSNGCNVFTNTYGNSTITISIATAHEIKGTIHFIGYNGCDTGADIITGDFDYNY